uniref:peptidylamidoglycolate lyase n=1 Tax=Saccoglossus kowalevskii TaxID=10224 RepID=A0ABM0MEA0_SACKO|nr:PREDICTED: peptidyl-glycine alpha-amidating monooxygenase B-like [Saccoglossus kowalevskii]
MSSPITSEYNIAMQEFTNLSYTTSEQHKDLTEARMKRDTADLEKISSKLAVCSPFSPDSSLRNIVTGVVAEEGKSHNPANVPVAFRSNCLSPFSFDNNNVFTEILQGPIPENVILTLDSRTGAIMESWGADKFYLPHGITIDHEDNIWLTDVAMHQVFKYSNTLQLLLTLGVRFVPGGDDKHFCSPTDVAVSRDGNFFVSDGYCNSRILQFNQMGDLIGKIYGQTPGLPAPHVFKVPHSLSLDADHNRLFVADRENGRVIVFNSDSKTFIDQYTGFGERVFAADYNKINGKYCFNQQ